MRTHLRVWCVVAVVVFGFHAPPTAQAPEGHWVASWATASVARPSPRFTNQTLRQIVHPTLGGSRVRIVLSNVFGTAPLRAGAVAVARARDNAGVLAGSARRVTFAGAVSAEIPAGAIIESDPVSVQVGSLEGLAIDVYLPGDAAGPDSALTVHPNALQLNYVSAAGNHAGAMDFPVASTVTPRFFLARVDVFAPLDAAAMVALGDSITDGAGSTADTNDRWPDHVARALAARGLRMGVVNLGISGNRVLADGAGTSTLNRFERDVLSQPGATHLVFVEGITISGVMRQRRPHRGASAADWTRALQRIEGHWRHVVADGRHELRGVLHGGARAGAAAGQRVDSDEPRVRDSVRRRCSRTRPFATDAAAAGAGRARSTRTLSATAPSPRHSIRAGCDAELQMTSRSVCGLAAIGFFREARTFHD